MWMQKAAVNRQKKLVETGFALAALKVVGQPGPAGDCRVCQKSNDHFAGKSRTQNIRSFSGPTGSARFRIYALAWVA